MNKTKEETESISHNPMCRSIDPMPGCEGN